eukprot:ANDGO_05273.mRNA.1 hypothetical protein
MKMGEAVVPLNRVYCDLDGVLCDFEAGVRRACRGRGPSELALSQMWSTVSRIPSPGFYATLPWMPDGKTLWSFLAPYSPTILSGLPHGSWAAPQKHIWCARELGPDVPVVLCMSRNKHRVCHPPVSSSPLFSFAEGEMRDVLIDDREELANDWIAKGGVFILHTTAAESIAQLKNLGFSDSAAEVQRHVAVRKEFALSLQEMQQQQSQQTSEQSERPKQKQKQKQKLKNRQNLV